MVLFIHNNLIFVVRILRNGLISPNLDRYYTQLFAFVKSILRHLEILVRFIKLIVPCSYYKDIILLAHGRKNIPDILPLLKYTAGTYTTMLF